eukprot:CAMPEP_0201716070 /NCGR_PEP_ID=MMETSP0593-20130828/2116_1 /ASSEMBLY_ACC=CAM_ASM_000672 /TAXON_ID=267983 /ORGANISM="Skeletonema japonicum, Strain CCMP2506" /LENGTH=287 /DNA_ID=CAMNT_0048205751 /DNA_START=69 /DNA_END=932 /DNA_ORIENTATION=+
MPPKRRNVYGKKSKGGLAYKRGDYIEYEYKGSIVTGKLNKKSLNGTEANPIWVVSPMDRRRKDEEIPEKQLGKVITAAEAMNNRAPKLGTKEEQANRAMSPMPPPIAATPSTSNSGSSSSDGSKEEEEEEEEEEPLTSASSKSMRRSGRLTPSVDSMENSKATPKKRRNRSDDESNNNSGSDGAAKSQKSVKFSPGFNDSSSSDNIKKKSSDKNKDRTTSSSARRTTRGSSGEALAGLLPDVMPRKKSVPKAKKLKKNEHVVVVKMLTGTLYLHRGDRRRAEFVRTK